MPRVRFQPLRINRRRWRQPWFSTSNTQYESLYSDAEKFDEEWEDDSYGSSHSESSSRASSGSYGSNEAMLDRRRKTKQQTASAYAPRRKCNLYFTVILGAILVVFILTLVQLHNRSAADVSSGVHKPEPKPPPWHNFPQLQRYFGGIRSLVTLDLNKPEYPGNEENIVEDVVEALQNASSSEGATLSERAADKHPQGTIQSNPLQIDPRSLGVAESAADCFLEPVKLVNIPQLQTYNGTTQGFPDPVVGSERLFTDKANTCFDRYGRLAPYGFGYSQRYGGSGAGLNGDLEDVDEMWSRQPEVDYRDINWSLAQNACIAANEHRFRPGWSEDSTTQHLQSDFVPRTAILVKTVAEQKLNLEEILNLRALVSETALATSGIFTVHFLIEVLDDTLNFWSDEEVYQRVLDESLPDEFKGMGTLWSPKQMSLIYAGLEDTRHGGASIYSVRRSSVMPIQHFARQHQEYDFFWAWDLGTRYFGHIGELLTQMDRWAVAQPRKELWERNARFYMPVEHGNWEDYTRMAHILAEHGPSNAPDIFQKTSKSSVSASDRSIWGPVPPSADLVKSSHVISTTRSLSADAYEWGVEEPADFLTLSPIFDPSVTTPWSPSTDVTGYNVSSEYPPRRASLSSTVRLSRRLLLAMHAETAENKRHMASEMWPSSIALHYGFKAVYVPHPMYVDRKWPTDYLMAVLNAGADGDVVGGRSSVFGDARRDVLNGLTWGSSGGEHDAFARRLWRRWLGYRDETSGEGGEEWEINGEGRMCVPPVLLEGVRDVNLVAE